MTHFNGNYIHVIKRFIWFQGAQVVSASRYFSLVVAQRPGVQVSSLIPDIQNLYADEATGFVVSSRLSWQWDNAKSSKF